MENEAYTELKINSQKSPFNPYSPLICPVFESSVPLSAFVVFFLTMEAIAIV